MKRIYQITILLVSILYIYSDDCISVNPSGKSDCHDKSDKSGSSFCCYYKIKVNGQTSTTCLPLTKEVKEKIKDYIKTAKNTGVEVESLDCKSSFIGFGLLSLIFLLL